MEKRSLKEKFKNEYIGKLFSIACAFLIIGITIAIIVFIFIKGLNLFIADKYSFINFIFKNNWNPGDETPSFGALSFIIGSVFVSAGAVILSAPVAISLAVFVNIISKRFGRVIMKPALEILVGIPSVVYGWVGISVLVPFVKNHFSGTGFSLLSGILVLALMILPTIATLSIDAVKTIPKDHIEASYGLGATRWQTIYKVIVPGSRRGILTGVILGIARAFGEALAVQMVIGNTIKIPNSLTSSMSTLTSILTMDMSNTVGGTVWNDALWSLAMILLIISFGFIVIVRRIDKGGK
ncbi:phosphate ABC transporter permease subunit PstC [Clostridium sp. BJN0001]|uniref:phosphate ABC transporter permease subunit PstC n=1 Tax=Clostridium sp. BJN0001 TaxID=2930219 RepID=UPI001FD07555|nr:phosphate ABC transporter permease subunit PstC [Clostridium sp. BJN0001]